MFAVIAAIVFFFVIKETIGMLSVLSFSNSTYLESIQELYKTHFGDILRSLAIFSDENEFQSIIQIFAAFVVNMEWICVVLIVIQLILLVLNFIFPKWEMLTNYLVLSFVLGLLYVIKYIALGINYGLFIASSMNVSVFIFLACSFFELFICSLWILKFAFNLKGDLKELFSE